MAQHWQETLPVDQYIVASGGLLHEYDRKVLTFLYQPLIGPACLSLYMTLWAELEENRLWSEPVTHHNLMSIMDMNLKDIFHARQKLEGMGLLKTFVKNSDEGRSFIYELQPPLTPEQFFLDGMLNVYLYRKVGKNQFSRLKRFFSDKSVQAEPGFSEITKAFQDVFLSVSPEALRQNQETATDMQAEEGKAFIGRPDASKIQIDPGEFNFELLLGGLQESLIPKKAFSTKVKEAISNLAFLYGIDALKMKNIVLSAVNAENEIDIDELRKAARDWYQFEYQDQLPALLDRVQPARHKANIEKPKTQEEELILYFEKTSPRQLLIDLSGGAEPSKADLQMIEEVMFKQKLLPGVVNVLVQYVMLKTDMKLTKGYIEKIASHWSRKKISTVKDAMQLAKNEHRQYLEWAEGKKTPATQGKRKPVRKEVLPEWFEKKRDGDTDKQENQPQVDPDFEIEKKKLEEELKKFKSGR
ncbi:replication initiation and membrane attachment family protein [Mesobacillus subterraneus]|uniref:Replication initiation and membrane attachment protein n=1 Tax=Mesobacillus subterraneus TaxID=285983 RepID=A0A427TTX8_9BACI|nr:replication initiation and membrane attachment family protein [Mesobacillus subterraneus]RSD27678.1 Replication initiation and membrane attachment protein [Mesobacillus subterraneus]